MKVIESSLDGETRIYVLAHTKQAKDVSGKPVEIVQRKEQLDMDDIDRRISNLQAELSAWQAVKTEAENIQ